MQTNIAVELCDGTTRHLPFKLDRGDEIYLDLTMHKYKVLYKNKEYSYYADEHRAKREVYTHPGAVMQVLGGK